MQELGLLLPARRAVDPPADLDEQALSPMCRGDSAPNTVEAFRLNAYVRPWAINFHVTAVDELIRNQ